MKLSDIKIGMTVYTESGKAYRVLGVDKQRYPVLVQSVANNTTGRFAPSSVSAQKVVR